MAALRGHSVYLADAKREIGGTIRLLAQDPNRRNLLDHAAYYESELGRLTVELLLGTTVTADELVEFAPDVLVVATGGRATVPAVPGIAGPHVVTAIQVLSGQASLSERVLVVGGFESHLAGPTVAEFAADQGRSVELISEHADFAKDAEDGTRFALIKRLAQKGVAFSSLHRLVDTEGDGATVANTLTGARRPLPSTTVVLACGLVPNDELVKDLRGRLPEVHVIGDALAPRRLMHATLEGARVGRAI